MNKQQIIIGGMTAAGATLAAALITPSEGLFLKPYKDPIGIVTDCWGHTKTAKLGRVNTEAECVQKLQTDMQEHWDGMVKCAPNLAKAPPRVQGAVLSWGFNVGVGNACASTLMRHVQAQRYEMSCAELSRWVWMGPYNCALPEHAKRCGGIPKRRAIERAACEGRPPSLGVAG